MRITELLSKESIALGVKVDSKDAAIDYLVNLHDAAGNISDKKMQISYYLQCVETKTWLNPFVK